MTAWVQKALMILMVPPHPQHQTQTHTQRCTLLSAVWPDIPSLPVTHSWNILFSPSLSFSFSLVYPKSVFLSYKRYTWATVCPTGKRLNIEPGAALSPTVQATFIGALVARNNLQPPAKAITHPRQTGSACKDSLPRMVCHIKWKSWHEILQRRRKWEKKKTAVKRWETLLDGSPTQMERLCLLVELQVFSWIKKQGNLGAQTAFKAWAIGWR